MKAVDLRWVLHEVVPPNYVHPNVLSEMVVKQMWSLIGGIACLHYRYRTYVFSARTVGGTVKDRSFPYIAAKTCIL